MNRTRLNAAHRKSARRLHFNGTITIWRPVPGGLEVQTGVYDVSVQQAGGAGSVPDPEEARIDERKTLAMYVIEPNAEVGDIVVWRGERWSVNATNADEGTEVITRLDVSREQIATKPESITFRRNTRTGIETVGTYSVHVVLDAVAGRAVRSTDFGGSETASGDTSSGAFIAGAEASALRIGDWFDRNGRTSRVATIDRENPERLEVGFTIQGVQP